MYKKTIFAALAALALLATACTKDENAPDAAREQVTITVDAADAAPAAAFAIAPAASGSTRAGSTRAAATRADAATPAYAPAGGTLTLLYGTLAAPAAQRAAYTCTDGTWATATPIYWDDLKPAAAGADKYPFWAAAPAVPLAAPAAEADQSTPANYAKSDQLMAYTATNERRTAVAFTLRHLLAQLTVTIDGGTPGTPTYLDPAPATIALTGPRTAYTIAVPAAPTSAVPATATVQAAVAAPTRLVPRKADGSHYLVLPAQTLAAAGLTITVTIGTNTYTWKSTEALTLVAAQNNTIRLNVSKTGLNLAASGITLAPWDDSPAPISGKATDPDIMLSDDAVNELPEAGRIGLSAFDGEKQNVGTGSYPVSYDPDKGAAIDPTSPGYAPLMWESLPKYAAGTTSTLQAYTYAALFSPDAVAPLNQEQQYLFAVSAAIPWGTAPTFTGDYKMKRAMSRLVVKINYGSDSEFSADDKAAATLTATRRMRVYAIGFSETSPEPVVTTAAVNDAEATVPMTAVTQPDKSVIYHAILCPQTLAQKGDTYITVNVAGRKYTLKAPQPVELVGGQQLTLTLTFSTDKTALTVGSIEIAPWTETTGDGELDWE